MKMQNYPNRSKQTHPFAIEFELSNYQESNAVIQFIVEYDEISHLDNSYLRTSGTDVILLQLFNVYDRSDNPFTGKIKKIIDETFQAIIYEEDLCKVFSDDLSTLNKTGYLSEEIILGDRVYYNYDHACRAFSEPFI
jgi:hypothetical protein